MNKKFLLLLVALALPDYVHAAGSTDTPFNEGVQGVQQAQDMLDRCFDQLKSFVLLCPWLIYDVFDLLSEREKYDRDRLAEQAVENAQKGNFIEPDECFAAILVEAVQPAIKEQAKRSGFDIEEAERLIRYAKEYKQQFIEAVFRWGQEHIKQSPHDSSRSLDYDTSGEDDKVRIELSTKRLKQEFYRRALARAISASVQMGSGLSPAVD